jgi:hypothetical protein
MSYHSSPAGEGMATARELTGEHVDMVTCTIRY